MPRIVEYLYLDQNRIDSYFEQISSPIKYDKVPKLSVKLSIVGPEASGEQDRPSRPFTTHEKIQALMNSLDLSRPLSFFSVFGSKIPVASFYEWLQDNPFDFRRFTAFRAILPSMPTANTPEVAIWVCRDTTFTRPLNALFLEHVREDPSRVLAPTSFTALQAIFNFVARKHSIIVPPEWDADARSTTLSEKAVEIRKRFVNEPRAVLGEWGAQIGPERDIESLYRLRAIMPDYGPYETVVGYPIFIADYPTGFEVKRVPLRTDRDGRFLTTLGLSSQ